MSDTQPVYTPFGAGLVDCRLPLLPEAEVRRLRAALTCHAFAVFEDAILFRIPSAETSVLERLLADPRQPVGDFLAALYHDFNTPFGYTATQTSDRLEAEFRVRFDWRAFELFPAWRPFVTIPNDLVVERWKRNRLFAEDVGLPVAEHRPMYRRTRNAMAALEYAKTAGMERVMRDAIYRAAWVDDRDIEDPSILKDIANESGINGLALEAAVVSGEFTPTLDRQRRTAISAGVFGAPTFVIGRHLIWGREPYSLVVEALLRCGVNRRAAQTGDV